MGDEPGPMGFREYMQVSCVVALAFGGASVMVAGEWLSASGSAGVGLLVWGGLWLHFSEQYAGKKK